MFPDITNVTTFPGIMEYNNEVTGGMFSLWAIIAVWMIMFLATSNRPKPVALMFASFVTCVVTVLLSTIGLVSSDVVVIVAIITVGSFAYLTMQSKDSPYT